MPRSKLQNHSRVTPKPANAAKADVQSRLTSGRPLDPVSQGAINALPSDQQSAYRTAAANAGKIFAAVGDMRRPLVSNYTA